MTEIMADCTQGVTHIYTVVVSFPSRPLSSAVGKMPAFVIQASSGDEDEDGLDSRVDSSHAASASSNGGGLGPDSHRRLKDGSAVNPAQDGPIAQMEELSLGGAVPSSSGTVRSVCTGVPSENQRSWSGHHSQVDCSSATQLKLGSVCVSDCA